MALKPKSSFSAGELDPALHERTNFEKYQTGLKTARNMLIARTGRIITRPGRAYFKAAKNAGQRIRLFSPANSGYLIEWGHLYVRIYNFSGTLLSDTVHARTEAQLPDIHFTITGVFVYAHYLGLKTLKLNFTTGAFVTEVLVFQIPPVPSTASVTTNTGSGYAVEYAITLVGLANNLSGNSTTGTEQDGFAVGGVGGANLPIGAAEKVVLTIPVPSSLVTPIEANVYRRPVNGGEYGFVGSTTYFDGTNFLFTDIGQAADYSQTFTRVVYTGLTPIDYLGKTGAVYQQRLLLTLSTDDEAILASRPGLQNNFMKDVPLNAASALAFKSGTTGKARILRMIDSDGLVVFTSVGVYLSGGELGPNNLSLAKKGSWIIDEAVPPLALPGGVLFVDLATNTIRQLSWSTEQAAYSGNELSSFSNHLFTGKRVVSWGFHSGSTDCLFVVLDDGTFVSFTYEPEQQMKAWTRNDSSNGAKVQELAETGFADITFFVSVDSLGNRHIERTVPRYISGSVITADPEAYMGQSIAAMDAMLSFKTLLNSSLLTGQSFSISPVIQVPDMLWDGRLDLTSGTSNIFSTTYGIVGTILRHFDSDGSSVDLEVVQKINNNHVIVQASSLFPATSAETARLYATATTVTGLTHLEGEYVAVIVDGAVVGSPNNDIEDYPDIQVISGSITLPNSMRGSIIHVGRPITFDTETLDMDSVEQRPILIESKTVNKVYIKSYQARGFYVGHEFPLLNKVEGMHEVDSYDVDYTQENPIIGNTYQKPFSRRHEISLPGDWNSNGRICIRGVDPVHFEILSIIPDVEDLGR